MVDPLICGFPLKRCAACGSPVGDGRIRRGLSCPRCPDGTPTVPGTCRKGVVKDTTRCHLHGGRGKVAQEMAKRKVAQRKAERLVITYGLPRDIDPHDALLEEIARTAGHIDWLGRILAELDTEEVAWGERSHEYGTDREGDVDKHTEMATPSIWLVLYQAERKHLVDVCRHAIAAGIAERQVSLAEEQGRLVSAVITAALADPELALRPEQQEVARVVVARHLRSVPSAA